MNSLLLSLFTLFYGTAIFCAIVSTIIVCGAYCLLRKYGARIYDWFVGTKFGYFAGLFLLAASIIAFWVTVFKIVGII